MPRRSIGRKIRVNRVVNFSTVHARIVRIRGKHLNGVYVVDMTDARSHDIDVMYRRRWPSNNNPCWGEKKGGPVTFIVYIVWLR